MASVRYRSGTKLSGGLYFSGSTADKVNSFTGSNWDSSVFTVEITLPEGSLDFAPGTGPSFVNNASRVATRFPWVWTLEDSTATNGSWAIIRGDGTVDRQGTGSYTYPAAGTYRCSVVGCTTLRTFVAPERVTDLINFGDAIENQYGGPYGFANAVWSSPTMPLFLAGPRTISMPLADFDATNLIDGWLSPTSWTGHVGSAVFYDMTNFTNNGIGGVGVGIDTWTFPGQIEDWIFEGTVTALTPNGLIDSNAQFDVDLTSIGSSIRYWSVINTTTGATASGVRSNNVVSATELGGFINTAQSRSGVRSINVPKDIFTAVGQTYKLVPHWSTNSNFGGAFQNWTNFNHYIGSWNLQGLVECFGGFWTWTNFNNGDAAGVAGGGVGQGMDNWDVSTAVSLYGVPTRGTAFNQYINSWNVGNNECFQNFFDANPVFNRPLDNWNIGEHLSSGQSVNLGVMFRNATAFNQDLSSWDVSKVWTMHYMFYNADSFNNGGVGGTGVGLDTWNTSNVESMRDMFNHCAVFNQDIGNWNVGKCSDAHGMFERAVAFNSKPTSGNWGANLPAGTTVDLSLMFANASAFNQDIGYFDTSRVSNMASMLQYTPFNNGGVGGISLGMDQWDVSKVTSFNRMFRGASSFNQYLGSWTFLTGDTATGTSTSVVANQLVDSTKDFVALGVQSSGMRVINNVTKKQANVTSVSTQNLVLDADIFTATGQSYSVYQWIDMFGMFESTLAYTQINVTNWNTENVCDMGYLFLSSSAAISAVDVSSWNVSRVLNMSSMFRGGGNPNVVNWDVSSCKSFNGMFYGNTSFTRDISGWDTRNVENLSAMFRSTAVNTTDFSGWNIQSLTNASLFYPGNMSTANYDALLDSTTGWASQSTIQNNVTLSSGSGTGPQYTAGGNAEAGRNLLTGTYGWTIIDGGPV